MSSSAKERDPSGTDRGSPRDRRATPRAAIEIPAIMHVGDREIGCSIRDLSTRGMALTVKEGVAPGMVVRVAFRLPGARQPVEVAGVLVRAAGGGGESTVALELMEPGADARRAIESFVERNRSDIPFSDRRGSGPDAARGATSESEAALQGLYEQAVGEVDKKDGKRRSLLDRLLRRGKS